MTTWPHAPTHHLTPGTFFITGGTYLKQPFYCTASALDELQELLFANALEHEVQLQAWVLLSNHYHLVIHAEDGTSLRRMLSRFHTEAAIACNRRDGVNGRKVWYQFWDKTLTIQTSWLARLRYTHENAVHHGIVRVATEYRWCSASWFERTAGRSFVATVKKMGMARLNVYDPY